MLRISFRIIFRANRRLKVGKWQAAQIQNSLCPFPGSIIRGTVMAKRGTLLGVITLC